MEREKSTTVGELVEMLQELPQEVGIIVCCMDGIDIVKAKQISPNTVMLYSE